MASNMKNLYMSSAVAAGGVAIWHILRLFEVLIDPTHYNLESRVLTEYLGFIVIMFPWTMFIIIRSLFSGRLWHTFSLAIISMLYWTFVLLRPSIVSTIILITTASCAVALSLYCRKRIGGDVTGV